MFELSDSTWRKLMTNPGKWKDHCRKWKVDKSQKNVPDQPWRTFLDELPIVLATKSAEFAKFVLPQLNNEGDIEEEEKSNYQDHNYQDQELTLKQEIIC